MQDLAEFLVRRYPGLYTLTRHEKGEWSTNSDGWNGAGKVKAITILPLGVTYDLEVEDPLKVADLLCVANFASMRELLER